MVASCAARSIDALIVDDPRALDDEALKDNVRAFARARAQLDAAEATTLAEFDRRGCYVDDGMVSASSWLAHHTGLSRKVAGGRVKLSRQLREMPLMAEALSSGRVTEQHARALRRCLGSRTQEAFVRDEEMLVEQATLLEADDFDRVITLWISRNDIDGVEPPAPQATEAYLSPTFGGRAKLDADLDPEDAALVRAEVERVYEEIYKEDQRDTASDAGRNRTRAQRIGAAIVEVCRRSAAIDTSGADDDDNAPPPRRPLIVVVVDYDAVLSQYVRAELEDGTPLNIDVLDRWVCEAGIARVVMKGRSLPVDLGTTVYTPSSAQRRALIARDRGCIVPGCRRKARWCQAHHVVPYPNGPTNLSNLVLLCHRHHKYVHAGIIKLVRDGPDDRWTVLRRDGTRVECRPPPRAVA